MLDGHSLAYRAFYALPDTMTTADGQPTNAVYGFASMLFKVLQEIEPDAAVVAFDVSRSDLKRTEVYPEYKSHRKAMPDELGIQMGMIEELLSRMKVPVIRMSGYEADDLLGTMSRMAGESGDEAIIVTGDRDILQLAREGTEVLLTSRGITDTIRYTANEVKEEYGVQPERIPDIVGLKGDTSDNIPGVSGIGKKGACSLIQEYGSLEGVYENIESISGPKRKSSLIENREEAFLSRDLATIEKGIPIEMELDNISLGDWDAAEVLDYLSSLEFRTLEQRFAEYFGSPLQAGSTGGELHYSLVDSMETGEIEAFRDASLKEGAVAVSGIIEGSGFCEVEASVFALALGDRALVTPVGDELSKDPCASLARSLLRDESVEKWLHNGKPLLQALAKAGITVAGEIFDTALSAYLENPSLPAYRIRDIWEKNAGLVIYVEGQKEREREYEQGSLIAEGGSEAGRQVVCDAARVYHLKPVLDAKIQEAGMKRLLDDIERPLMIVLKEMEECGVAVDVDEVRRLSSETALELEALEAEIFELSGHSFNIGSTKQLAAVLFGEMGIHPVKKTKTGFSTDSSVLEVLSEEHEIAEKIVKFRELSKLKSTYFDALPALVCPMTGRIHCSFNQTATSTGRISSSGPNLQNIPVRTEEGRKIREAFVPGETGWSLVVADYSQIELRVLAHMSSDARLIRAFRGGEDVHRQTASEVFGAEPGEITPEMRRMAKVVNFGVIYGMGDYGLSSRLGISREEASRFIKTYFEKYCGVAEYRERCIEEAERRGFVETLLGRRRFIPELKSAKRHIRELGERLAVNTPIQGSAADIIKKAMVDVASSMRARAMRSRITIQIHDELILDVPPEEKEAASDLVRDKMSGVLDLEVPLSVDIGIYENWGQAKQ